MVDSGEVKCMYIQAIPAYVGGGADDAISLDVESMTCVWYSNADSIVVCFVNRVIPYYME